jgi:DNA gyrase subunit A
MQISKGSSMPLDRPDLGQVAPDVRAYIESLEAELETLKRGRKLIDKASTDVLPPSPPLEPGEPPTTIQIITLTSSGIAKRTPRHLYNRQRRGGMGIFGLDADENDPPAILLAADEGQHLLLFTSFARVFRLAVNIIPEAPVRARGQSIAGKMALPPEERLVAALVDQAKGAVALVSERGIVRYLRHHVFGEYMKPGTSMFDPARFGELAAVCRTPGDADLFIATRRGKAIRFSEKLVPPQGGPGIRLEDGDTPVAITAIYPEGQVFLADQQGSGAIRLMSGFNANKSAGGGGKIAMNTDHLVAAFAVNEGDDIFMISRLSKIIRFRAIEVPPKEGVVQGVDCMLLRADAVNAVTVGQP